MRSNEFYSKIDIADEDKPRAEQYLYSKGLEQHIFIATILANWQSEQEEHNQRKIRYSEIATIYRYDKRIRNVLYKYISYIEEFLRARVLDKYSSDTKQDFWIPEIQRSLSNGKSLKAILDDLLFSNLLRQVMKIPEIRDKAIFVKEHITKNKDALIELRNDVMHNKFLLLYGGFKVCYVDGVKKATLRANIFNFANFLPSGVKEKFFTDINNCKENRNKENETKWDLPEWLTLTI